MLTIRPSRKGRIAASLLTPPHQFAARLQEEKRLIMRTKRREEGKLGKLRRIA